MTMIGCTVQLANTYRRTYVIYIVHDIIKPHTLYTFFIRICLVFVISEHVLSNLALLYS